MILGVNQSAVCSRIPTTVVDEGFLDGDFRRFDAGDCLDHFRDAGDEAFLADSHKSPFGWLAGQWW